MTVFDNLFFNVFNHYKLKHKRKANSIALFYISLLKIALVLLLGLFFSEFFNQMNVRFLNKEKAWTLFVLTACGVYTYGWLKYNGKSRKILNAKATRNKNTNYNIWLLWALPLGVFILSFLLSEMI